MRNAIILHGMPSEDEYHYGVRESEKHWLPWLREELVLRGIDAVTPEMPRPFAPEYTAWKAAFEEFPVTKETILIGHSCGAGFLTRWLSENHVGVGKVTLVAPWIDPVPRTLSNGFFEFTPDPLVIARAASITFFSSSDDEDDIQESVRLLKLAWPSASHKEYEGKGHFDDGMKEFPDLLKTLVS